jgi:hypothetical protein
MLNSAVARLPGTVALLPIAVPGAPNEFLQFVPGMVPFSINDAYFDNPANSSSRLKRHVRHNNRLLSK